MIQCQNCGQVNSQASNFCRFCGAGFFQAQNPELIGYESAPPRPYVWKTDEFQVSEAQIRKNKTINQVQPLSGRFAPLQNTVTQSPVFRPPQNTAYAYRCPRCANRLFPKVVRRISTAGWVVFAVLMVAFFPLFWIGLLIKEDVRVCSICNARIGC